MYYRLKNEIALRGWEKLPYALRDLTNGGTMFIGQAEFDALSLCDGETVVGHFSTLPLYMEIIEKAKERGIVVQLEEPFPLMPWQKYHLHPSRYIRQAHWSITGHCNYKCKHCYMSAPDAKFGELTQAQCFKIIDELYECGIASVTLTGGEALLRADFWELVDRLFAYGIQIETIYTNGALLTPEVLDACERRKIMPAFSLSFDGIGWHDWMRGIDGAEQIAIDALKLCQARGFRTSVEMCIFKHNKHTLRDTVNLLATLGVGAIKTNPASLSGAWIENGGDAHLKLNELFEVYLDYIPHFFADGAPVNIQLGGFFMASKGEKEYILPSVKFDGSERAGRQVICGHARQVMYISAEGRILPCMSLSGLDIQSDYPLVTEQGLIKCLTDSHYMRLIGTTVDGYLAQVPECEACEHKYHCCSGCRASAYESGGEFMGPDRAVCAIYKGGYIPRIIEAAKGYNCTNYKEE